ncbi:hypothetical protein Tco_0191502, partial [Tanacetum coccineum]
WCMTMVVAVARGASGYGDRVDPMVGSLFGFGRKSPPENFSGGGSGGRRRRELAGEDDREREKLVRWDSNIKGSMAGSKTSSQGISLAHFAKECHVDSKKAQGCVGFTLLALTQVTQGVTITDCHAGNPCVHICDPTAKANESNIEGMMVKLSKLVTDLA